MLPLFRYFILPFSFCALLFTGYINSYRAEDTEWLIMTARTKSAESYSHPLLYVLHPDSNAYFPLPTERNAYVRAVSADGQWIYFTAIAEHHYEGGHTARDIYRMPMRDFSSVESLTNQEFIDNYFSGITSDGQWLYYSSEKAFDPSGTWRSYRENLSARDLRWWDVFKMKVDGSEQERLTSMQYENHWFLGEIGPDNYLLLGETWNYYPYRIYAATPTGNYSHELRIPVPFNGFLDISSDKEWLYYMVAEVIDGTWWRKLHRIRWDDTEDTMLAEQASDHMPDSIGFSPADEWFYYRLYDRISYNSTNEEALSHIYRLAPDNPSQPVVVATQSFVWHLSPDNQWLYYAQNGNRIYRLNTTTQVYEELAELNTYNYFLSFSPNGKWLYFRSVEGENAYLYRMRLNGSGLENLGNISDLDMCIYPDRCQDNLFMVEDFGMQWHPQSLLLGAMGLMVLVLITGVRLRNQRRKQFAKGEFAHA